MRIEEIEEMLRAEGFRPEPGVDEAGNDRKFKFEGGTYYLLLEPAREDLADYVRMVFPNFFSVPEGHRARLVEVAHESTREVKAAKVFVEGQTVFATAEFFIPDVEGLRKVLLSNLRAIQAIANAFAQKASKV